MICPGGVVRLARRGNNAYPCMRHRLKSFCQGLLRVRIHRQCGHQGAVKGERREG